ncbi:MAG: hypothetical protein AB1352_05385 [Patescibacteria group bacterium]
MLQEILSYSVLILIPLITLIIVVFPYWWVYKRQHPVLKRHLWSAFIAGFGGVIGWWWLIDIWNNERISIYLWGTDTDGILLAFLLYSLFLPLTPFLFSAVRSSRFSKIVIRLLISIAISLYVIFMWPMYRIIDVPNGVAFALFFLSFCLPLTPFVYYEFRHPEFTRKGIIIRMFLSCLIVALVISIWVVLAIIGYRGLFYRLN